MDANDHNNGNESAPSKKHAIEQSPRVPPTSRQQIKDMYDRFTQLRAQNTPPNDPELIKTQQFLMALQQQSQSRKQQAQQQQQQQAAATNGSAGGGPAGFLQKPKLEQQNQSTTNDRTGDELDKIEKRVTKLEKSTQTRGEAFRKKLDDQGTFFTSEINKKLDQDAAMTPREHENLITDISKMVTRAYLRKTLEDKIKGCVDDIIEDIVKDLLSEKLAERDAVLARLLKERVAAIKGLIVAKADQLEHDEELAVIRRTLEEQRRQLAAIWDWIHT